MRRSMASSLKLPPSVPPPDAEFLAPVVRPSPPRSEPGFSLVSRLLALAVVGGLVLGLALALIVGTGGPDVLFAAKFPKQGLVTNEYSYYNPGNHDAIRSSDW